MMLKGNDFQKGGCCQSHPPLLQSRERDIQRAMARGVPWSPENAQHSIVLRNMGLVGIGLLFQRKLLTAGHRDVARVAEQDGSTISAEGMDDYQAAYVINQSCIICFGIHSSNCFHQMGFSQHESKGRVNGIQGLN